LQLNRGDATYPAFLGEEIVENSTEAQRSAEALARKAELAAKREAAIKARLQAEAEASTRKPCGFARFAWQRKAANRVRSITSTECLNRI
jgi:hypothetical protein